MSPLRRMSAASTLLVVLSLAIVPFVTRAQSAAPKPIALEDYARFKRITSAAISADGKMLAYHDDERVAALPLRGAGRPMTLVDPVSDYVVDDTSVALGWTRDGRA